MLSSNQLFNILKDQLDLPKHVTSMNIYFPSAGEPAIIQCTTNVFKKGKYIIENDEIKSETKQYWLMELGVPHVCACCGKYVTYHSQGER